MSQHASEELERLTAEKAKMEKDKTTLGFVLRDGRTGTDSVRYGNKLFYTNVYISWCKVDVFCVFRFVNIVCVMCI